jgi:hypothetical protein
MNCQTQLLLQRNFITRIRSLPGGIPPTGEYRSSIVLPLFIAAGSRSYIRSKTNCLRFRISIIVICPSTWLREVVSLSNHLIFVFCYLKFLGTETPEPRTSEPLNLVNPEPLNP